MFAANGGATPDSSKTYIEDVFSTYLYTGNRSTQTINNGIDLAGKGGMVWIKPRPTADWHYIFDTTRTPSNPGGEYLSSNSTAASSGSTGNYIEFNSNGYTSGPGAGINENGRLEVSWTFRKAPKFFDVVTYTGNGVDNRQIAHSLNAYPGMIIIKRTDTTSNWPVWHIGHGVPASIWTQRYATFLNQSGAQVRDASYWNDTYPSETTFTVGNNADVNASGGTYVAYVFSMSGRGGFGDSGTDSIISCGSYAGNGSTTGPEINLGWEPQYVLIKCITNSYSWIVVDVMRGMAQISYNALELNNSNAEYGSTSLPTVIPTSTGFKLGTAGAALNGNGQEYIYMAIRRGPMKTPTDPTKVFETISLYAGSGYETSIGFPADLIITKNQSNGYQGGFEDRIRGLATANTTGAAPLLFTEGTYGNYLSSLPIVYNVWNASFRLGGFLANNTNSHYLFRRAPGFFDMLAHAGTSISNETIYHNLKVKPEMVISKWFSGSTPQRPEWIVSANNAAFDNNVANSVQLNSSGSLAGSGISSYSDWWTDSYIKLDAQHNSSGTNYMLYFFASCPGISKVGAYTGTGTTQQINCGFTSGARFIMIKRTDSSANWYVWDAARGITSGNDPFLFMNTQIAQTTSQDYIDPYAAGFEISSGAPSDINALGGKFLYLAIA